MGEQIFCGRRKDSRAWILFLKLMNEISYYTTAVAFGIVIIAWIIFAGTFLFLKKPKQSDAPEKSRAPRSIAGIALQGLGFTLVWALHRTPFLSPFVGEQYMLNIVLQILTILLVVGSVWLSISAITELGRQWSLTARLIKNHQLVTSGVYQIVRHPIYTAMFGMMTATALVLSHWLILIIATVIFLLGTKLRTSGEEELLREAFPQEYENYRAQVPALIPFVKIF